MNAITQTEAVTAAGYTAAADYDRTQGAKSTKESQAYESSSTKKTRYTAGKTIGEPELSEKAQKYYEQLKKKYGNMDFILVSRDMKQQAQANAGRYANPNRMVVLIDEDKIERMAEDEDYRKQYEGIISSATKQLPQIQSSLGVNAGSVKGYGMKVDDGGNASFFAVIDKSLAAQRDRITKKTQQKAEAKKKEAKEAQLKRAEEKRAEKAEEKKKAEKQGRPGDVQPSDDENTITVTASSVDELIRKINDTIFALRSEYIQSDQERRVGQRFDFSI